MLAAPDDAHTPEADKEHDVVQLPLSATVHGVSDANKGHDAVHLTTISATVHATSDGAHKTHTPKNEHDSDLRKRKEDQQTHPTVVSVHSKIPTETAPCKAA